MTSSDSDIPIRLQAMGIWARCWQLAGGVWPPQSRAITHQIVMMVCNYLVGVSNGRLSRNDALQLARDTMTPLTAQRFFTGSEQDIAIDRISEAILMAELGDFPDLPTDLQIDL